MTTRSKVDSAKDLDDRPTPSMPAGDAVVSEGDTKNGNGDEIVTLEDDTLVTFNWLGDKLGVPKNTIVRRWFPEKVLPAYKGVDCPPLRTEQGRLTGFGAKAIALYYRQCVQGQRSWESWRNEVRSSYQNTSSTAEIVEAELVDDDEPIAPPGAMALLQQLRVAADDQLDDEISDLVFQNQQVQLKRQQLEALQKKQRQAAFMRQAIARKMADLAAQEEAIDAEMQAELLVNQALEGS